LSRDAWQRHCEHHDGRRLVRLCTLRQRALGSSHSAAVTYSYAPRSQVTSVLLPSSRKHVQGDVALAVPAAGYLIARGADPD